MKSKASQEGFKLTHRLRQDPGTTKNSGKKKNTQQKMKEENLWKSVWQLEHVSIKTGFVYNRLL